jgi:hypothetical protein
MNKRKPIARRRFLQESAALLGTSSLLTETGISWTGDSAGGSNAAPQGRLTVSLDGDWQIADSVSADEVPQSFEHVGPVPGMANLAKPRFPDVDAFLSPESIQDRRDFKVQPESELAKLVPGPRQKRNYFWYQKTFRVPAKREVAILKINKAQFGTAVWLNEGEAL